MVHIAVPDVRTKRPDFRPTHGKIVSLLLRMHISGIEPGMVCNSSLLRLMSKTDHECWPECASFVPADLSIRTIRKAFYHILLTTWGFT